MKAKLNEVVKFVLSFFNVVSGDKHSHQYTAHCPAHDDEKPSLSIKITPDGKLLAKCHAGCAFQEILTAAGLETYRGFPIVNNYEYYDESGAPLYQVCRTADKQFPVRTPNGKWGRQGRPSVLYRLPELFAALEEGSGCAVFICEGEKDVDRCRAEGLVATCVMGGASGKWLKKHCGVLRGREVVVLADNDAAGKKFASGVASSLNGIAKSVKVVEFSELPEHGDVSDFFDAGHTVRELFERVENTEEWAPGQETPTSGTDETPEHSDCDDPHWLAQTFLLTQPHLRWWRDVFYEYNAGVYRPVSLGEIRALLTAHIKEKFDEANEKRRKVTRNPVSNTTQALESLCLIRSTSELPVWLTKDTPISAENAFITKSGILDLASGRVIPHTPDLFSCRAVNYEFDIAAKCSAWMKFILSLWPDDKQSRQTLQEMMGYLLSADTGQQKIFMLLGPKRSGKGTIARAIRKLIGEDNVAAPTLKGLQGEFGLQPLLVATLAVIGDARLSNRSDVATIIERLLSISGEDAQTVNRKNLPQVTTQLRTRFLLITNELPRLDDASATLPSRLVVLEMKRSWYGKEDLSLTESLLSELPGILNWAMAGLKRLMERGHFIQPKSSRALIEQLEDLASPVLSFVRERCELDRDSSVSRSILYQDYEVWCGSAGMRPKSKNVFGRDLRAAVPEVRDAQVRDKGKRKWHYQGIRLRKRRGVTGVTSD